MSLSLTPIGEAWAAPSKKKKKQEIPNKKTARNVYANPEMQTKILKELGMLNDDPEYEQPKTEVKEPQTKEIETFVNQPTNSLSLNITNPQLMSLFKPYSNEYIEMMILKCVSQNNNGSELHDLVESVYLMVSMLLVLVIIDIAFHFKK